MPNKLKDELEHYGPLAHLIGLWEGDKGDDVAPSDDRGTENNKFREQMEFAPMGVINNHEQVLYGLRYRTTAWRVGEADPFHEELGYWLWDAKEKQVMRCFMVPRGVTVIAGGTANPEATGFTLNAKVGSTTYGICSNLFLDREFKTVSYTLKLEVQNSKVLIYEEDSELQIKGQKSTFHHTDKNRLQKVRD